MNEKLKKMLEAINAKKDEVKALAADGKLDEAEAAKKDLKKMQREFDLVMDLDDDPPAATGNEGNMQNAANAEPVNTQQAAPTVEQVGSALVAAIKARLKGKKAPKDAAEILMRDAQLHNKGMKEGDPGAEGDDGADGGLTVPQDISTQIKELRRAADDDLERYVNVENVATQTGSRVIEVDADAVAWPEVAEEGKFQEQDTPTLRNIKYKIKKYGGILKVTAELLEDSAENILAYLKKWIAKKSRATRNAKILAALDDAVGETTYKIEGIDDLKDIFNIVLDPAIAQGGIIMTNQTGFNFLDKLKDRDENYILQPDPTDKTKRLLFGEYPLVKLSNKVLKNVSVEASGDNPAKTEVPVFCGQPAEAVTLFDRNVISLDISSTAGDLWEKDKTGLKVRDRFDVQVVDGAAIVKGVISITTAG